MVPGDALAYRTAAIRLLGRGIDGRDADVALLQSLLAPQHPDRVQSAAVAALGRLRLTDTAEKLLGGWSSHTPALRQQILDLLGSRDDWSLALLDAVEKGQVPAQQIDARRRQQLATAKSDKVRQRAEKVLAAAVDPNRQKIVEHLPEGDPRAARPMRPAEKQCLPNGARIVIGWKGWATRSGRIWRRSTAGRAKCC